MAVITFAKAVNDILEPAGFVRIDKESWSREDEDYHDLIDIQIQSNLTKITVNVYFINKSVRDEIASINLDNTSLSIFPVNVRLNEISRDCAQWWVRSDPDARQDMARCVMTHGLPFLERMRAPESMAKQLEPICKGRWGSPARLHLAVIYRRLGREADACAMLSNVSTRSSPDMLALFADMRRRYGCPPEPPNPNRPGA